MVFFRQGIYERPAYRQIPIRHFLELLRALVVRDFRSRYRRSILGPLWAALQPIAYTAVFMLVRNVVEIDVGNDPYVLVAFIAMVPWLFFANTMTRCSVSVHNNASVVKKMAMPREVFPTAAVCMSLIDMMISALILGLLLLWFRTPVTTAFLWLPVLVLTVVALSGGVGLGLAALGTFKTDIAMGVPILLQLGLFATPVIYPLNSVDEGLMRQMMSLNPMAGIIEGFRTVLLHGQPPDSGLLLISWCGVLAVWIVCWPLFRYMSQYFADVL